MVSWAKETCYFQRHLEGGKYLWKKQWMKEKAGDHRARTVLNTSESYSFNYAQGKTDTETNFVVTVGFSFIFHDQSRSSDNLENLDLKKQVSLGPLLTHPGYSYVGGLCGRAISSISHSLYFFYYYYYRVSFHFQNLCQSLDTACPPDMLLMLVGFRSLLAEQLHSKPIVSDFVDFCRRVRWWKSVVKNLNRNNVLNRLPNKAKKRYEWQRRSWSDVIGGRRQEFEAVKWSCTPPRPLCLLR